MSATTREQIGRLSQNAEELLHETWELFARLRKTNDALLQQTKEMASKISSLSRRAIEDDRST
jgi:hypothetical protein